MLLTSAIRIKLVLFVICFSEYVRLAIRSAKKKEQFDKLPLVLALLIMWHATAPYL